MTAESASAAPTIAAGRSNDTPSALSAPVRRLLAACTECPGEWLVILTVALIDILWAERIRFSVSARPLDEGIFLAGMIAGIVLRARARGNRLSLAIEFYALSLGTAAVLGTLSYLCGAVDSPLIDKQLLALDRLLGFDWLACYRLIASHPAVEAGLRIAYASPEYQAVYLVAFFGMLGRKDRLREIFWVMFIAGLITPVISAFLPAFGTFDAFGMRHLADYIPDMEKLRAGADLHFALGKLTGIVTFPSFHTTVALIYCYAFRRTGAVGHAVTAINLVMLVSIPFFGGHYLVDMLGGAAVAAATILAVRYAPTLALLRWAAAAADPCKAAPAEPGGSVR